ncbi:RagB/SusD family nutrient uptake outer membrane protein [Polaribacter porphyrae]|uniref:RagB/SusD family nutrient uptake outer membrane protein n=1 Tax=Polaribacter porphyrae TaxID=1137780 RepID=A0A2S7WTI8_9FLAO|nr:RagB/SusD family nutrient uptake outer membrane protein [Polaribacter porphyrae]PQJ80632.1 RagB/SusD family nutrient uptake outer membrane protein [Polaribacter porphyrae]
MKTQKLMIKLFLAIIFISVVSSCSEDYLKENPTSFIDATRLVVDEAGAELYLVGAYDAVQESVSSGTGAKSNLGWGVHWGTMATDEVVVPGWAGDRKLIFLQQVTPNNATVRNMWVNLFVNLNKVNSVVDRISALTEDQIDIARRDEMIGEAKFLRATIYFAIVSTWENVPLIKNETKDLKNIDMPAQSTPQEVYDFIVEDLKFAESNLEAKQGGGRATKGAAQALLGKVYLQMTGHPLNQSDKFALAEAELLKVINSGVYSLLPNYPEVFDLNNEQSSEMVFSIGMDGPGSNEGGILSSFYGPLGFVSNGAGFGTCWVNATSVTKYDANDIRLLNNIAKHNANQASPEEGMNDPSTWGNTDWQWKPWKWHASKPNAYTNDTPFDNPYIRYADVLLMYAEALNGQSGKLTQAHVDATINTLRARAALPASNNLDIAGKNQTQIADEILDERYRELFIEGWRRNDLIRFGKYESTIKAINQSGWTTSGNPGSNYQDYEIRWPIPDPEIKLNPNLVQNPGYN